MSISIEEFNQLKKQAEELRRKADRAEGAILQAKEQLQKEFGCSDKREAMLLEAELVKQLQQEELVYQQELAKYKEQFGDK